MAFVVLYDACVLHPAALRDILLRVAITGLVQARWSDRILDECFESILDHRPDLNQKKLARTRELMERAMPEASVRGYEAIERSLHLPDANDRHVLAAAIRSGAQTIVTLNLRDFPKEALEPYDIDARHPDEFILGLLDLAPGAVIRAIEAQRASLKSPKQSRSQLLDTLRDQGLVQSVARLRDISGAG